MRANQIVLMLMTALVLSACSMVTSHQPGNRVVEAMELIRDGKPKQLNDYILQSDVEGSGMFYGFMSSAFMEKGGVSRFEIESEVINGDSASVKVRWHYKKGGSDHESFPLKREDGKWRINL